MTPTIVAPLILFSVVATINAGLWDDSINQNLCNGIKQCDCYVDQMSFELFCPRLDKNVRISIPDGYYTLHIECKISAEFRFDNFPKLNINRIYGIRFVNCSIPANDSFGPLLEHFGIKKVDSFEANKMGRSLQREFEGGFEKLAVLTLRGNGIVEIHENAFQALPELRDLYLSQNKISILPRSVFYNLSKLSALILSKNELKSLPEGIFTHQKELKRLYLDNNRLENLTKEMFTGLSSLGFLYLHDNNLKRLTENVFHNIPALKYITLGNVDIKYEIPDNIFGFNYHLEHINLERVKISDEFRLNSSFVQTLRIDESEFQHFNNSTLVDIIPHPTSNGTGTYGSRSISDLSLSRNQLVNLDDGLFNGLYELWYLRLSYNNLSTISEFIFRELYSLAQLDLAYNRLQMIHSRAFDETQQLEFVDLSNNQIFFNDYQSPFRKLVNLKTLNLYNNHLTSIPSNLASMEKLVWLDLRFNHISFEYDELTKKLPSNVTFHLESEVENNFGSELADLHLLLYNNSLKCSCRMYEVLQQKDRSVDRLLDDISNICMRVDRWMEIYFECFNFKCPVQCECFISNATILNEITITCNDRGLTTFPEIPFIENRQLILELYINDNSLTELPNLQNNSHITFINSSHNSICNIKQENLPPNLRILDVSHNQIQMITSNVYETLSSHATLEMIYLAYNPWLCDCSSDTAALVKFIVTNISITDLEETKCKVSSEIYYQLTLHDLGKVLQQLCFNHTVMLASIILAVFSLVIGVLGVLFYKYQQLLKIWLYAHNACLWCIDEEELDKDKKFDAFISYSHHDEEFALNIVSELENGNPCFKICVHERDWLAGQLIAESIMDSMNNSRRTIVILSKHFLESVWGLHEFHCAYVKGLAEKRIRVIIIIYGDIGELDQLDPAIQSYLKSRTYIKWGEAWFWEKLRYALPHRSRYS